jgi:ABC-2 type transport system permease protein
MLTGPLHYLSLALRLNFRSKQAIIYGFAFPLLFLFAFWGIYYHKEIPPLANEMGQLLTVTILSGACFGMPTAMVSERERGIWRRYRLLPSGTGGIVLAAMVVRCILVAIAMILQIILAHFICKAAWPAHPFPLIGIFFIVTFAFLGLGLMIAMLADNVPAVQALGQMIFLPMLMIGGIGVRLDQLPSWAVHIAVFLPGVYGVDAMDAALRAKPMATAIPLHFCLLALLAIGAAGCIAGAMMFRWDAAQKMTVRARGYVAVALLAWLAVGAIAEATGHVQTRQAFTGTLIAKTQPTSTSQPTTQPITVASTEPSPATTQSTAEASTMPASNPTVASTAPWTAITDADVNKITFSDLQPDSGDVTPVAPNLDNLDEDDKKRIETFTEKLDEWPPGKELDIVQRTRSYLAVAAIVDLLQDQLEPDVPYVIFDRLRYEVEPDDKLKRVLTYIIMHPDQGTVPTKIPDLGFDGEVFEEGVRDRVTDYARKLLARVLNKTY